jgi:hypothetical protein
VNPLATISALSERSVSLVTKKAGLSIDFKTLNGPLDAKSKPKVCRDSENSQSNIEKNSNSIGWQFTEALSGNIYMGPDVKNFELSESMGKGSSCAMQMFLTIQICKEIGKDLR